MPTRICAQAFAAVLASFALLSPAPALEADVGRLQVSIRNSVASRGKAFETEILSFFEAFLVLRTCNGVKEGGRVPVGDAELARARWWMHAFQSALRLELGVLKQAGISTDELWPAAERNTHGFRSRASHSRTDPQFAAELVTTCGNALAMFRTGEPIDPTKLAF